LFSFVPVIATLSGYILSLAANTIAGFAAECFATAAQT
jgi:hypothetical protein